MRVMKLLRAARVAIPVLSLGSALLLGCGPRSDPSGGGEEGAGPAPGVHPEIWPQVVSAVAADPQLEARVEKILAALTLEQKVGQVIQAEIIYITPEQVGQYHLGSVLVGGNGGPGGNDYAPAPEWLALADAFWEASMEAGEGEQPVPIIWGVDAVHGHANIVGATIFPHNIGLGATGDPELVRRIGEVTAIEMATTGLDWHFGPTIAVARDDRWGRAYEAFSEDPELVRTYASAMVEGLQGVPGSEGFLDESHVIATAKHFLGDGGTEGGVDQGDTRVPEEELRDIHGAGYVSALAAGVQTVMASYSSWYGDKLHGHKGLLTEVLKDRMGFDGFVIGDYNGHGQIPGCTNGSCPAALNAGVDMFMVPEDWKALYENTLAQVRSGEIAAERLDDAVRRIVRVKLRAGLFDRGKPSSRRLAGKWELLGAPEHRAVARQAVRESLVLLKNDGDLLPLRRDLRVLVAGDGADDIGKQCGGWTITWQGTGNSNRDFPGATSIWAGIRDAVDSAGGKAVLRPDGNLEGAFDAPPDVAIVVFGENPYAEFLGEIDSLEYRLSSASDLALLERLHGAGIPVVSIFLSGRPLWVNPELNASDAFVAAWLPGTEGGGIADVILRREDGEVNHDFTGKLSFSWPKEPAQTGVNRGDEGYAPLFPYGFGLGYGAVGEGAGLGELPESSAGGGLTVSRKVYFAGGPVPPWQLYVGDEADWAVPVSGEAATTAGSEHLVVSTVDRRAEGDARAARWSGGGLAQIYLQARPGVDIRREMNGNLALAFDVLVERAPAAGVTLRMDCGYPCSGALDVTDLLSTLPPGEWHPVHLRLRCFEEAGADMARIDTPFLIATEGELALRIADVKLVSSTEARCP